MAKKTNAQRAAEAGAKLAALQAAAKRKDELPKLRAAVAQKKAALDAARSVAKATRSAKDKIAVLKAQEDYFDAKAKVDVAKAKAR